MYSKNANSNIEQEHKSNPSDDCKSYLLSKHTTASIYFSKIQTKCYTIYVGPVLQFLNNAFHLIHKIKAIKHDINDHDLASLFLSLAIELSLDTKSKKRSSSSEISKV